MNRDNSGTHQAHTEHVWALALNVFCTHVHAALQAK
ncbi:Uncharacterised protein [Vibrio cholerae]|nr:Uncharacterised protein [Vibrio cholerae]